MLENFQRFIASDRGNVAVIFAVALVPLIGGAGAVVDYARLTGTRATLQSAADAAALAGAKAMMGRSGQASSTVQAAGTTAATEVVNGMVPGAQTAVTFLPGNIKVKVTREEKIVFGVLLGQDKSTVDAQSTAGLNEQTDCVFVMKPSEHDGLDVGKNAKFKSNCGIRVNSTDSSAVHLRAGGGNLIQTTSLCIVGGLRNDGGTVTPAAKTGCPAASDPLASVPEPTQATNACDYGDSDGDDDEDYINVPQGTTRTLNPGVYCANIIVNGGTLTFSPGIYVFRNDYLTVNNGGKATGTGVMLYFTGSEGRITLTSDSTLELSAPTSGTYKGIALFQNRQSWSSEFVLNSGSGMKLAGTVYMPNAQLKFNNGGSATVEAPWTAFVVRRIIMNDGSTVTVNTDYGAGPPLPTGLENLAKAPLRLVN
jgi:Flp pilus assembly protein TadG